MNYFFISIHFLLFIKIYQLIKADNNIQNMHEEKNQNLQINYCRK